MSGVLERFPDAQARVLRGPDRLDPLHPRAGRRGVGATTGLGRRRRQGHAAAERVLLRARLRLLLRRRPRPASRSSAVGVDNVTFETDYPHSDSTWPRHARRSRRALMKGLDRRRDRQDRPRQRHPHAASRSRLAAPEGGKPARLRPEGFAPAGRSPLVDERRRQPTPFGERGLGHLGHQDLDGHVVRAGVLVARAPVRPPCRRRPTRPARRRDDLSRRRRSRRR